MTPFTVHAGEFAITKDYFAIVATSGSETRCTQVARLSKAQRKFVYVYTNDTSERSVIHRSIFQQLGYTPWHSASIDLRREIPALLLECAKSQGQNRIAVDISSMTREAMAVWVYSILTTKLPNAISIDFTYSHAKFSPPPSRAPLAKNLSSVTPEFAGIFEDSLAPIMLILGLGYEPQLALSFLEFLEPASLIVFEPAHHDRQYTKAIRSRNKMFFNVVGEEKVVKYNVFNPFSLFQDLESSIQGASYKHRVHIAPYGTKLFAISGLLAAALHHPKIFVWNLNSIQSEDYKDREADGQISSITVRVPCQRQADGGRP